MCLQILLPVGESILQLGVGVAAAERSQSRIADPPGTIAAELTADQVGRLLWRRKMPVQIEVEQAERVGENGSYELFTTIGVA